eukprot:1191854-Prorocentrum_minimum.AAC.1
MRVCVFGRRVQISVRFAPRGGRGSGGAFRSSLDAAWKRLEGRAGRFGRGSSRTVRAVRPFGGAAFRRLLGTEARHPCGARELNAGRKRRVLREERRRCNASDADATQAATIGSRERLRTRGIGWRERLRTRGVLAPTNASAGL